MVLWQVRGSLPLDPAGDGAAVMRRVEQGLRGLACDVAVDGMRVLVRRGSPGRFSPFSFINGGAVWLDAGRLRYDFSTAGFLVLSLAMAAFAGTAAWLSFADPWLTGFGLLAPVLWLYGANYVLTAIRVRSWLSRSSRAA